MTAAIARAFTSGAFCRRATMIDRDSNRMPCWRHPFSMVRNLLERIVSRWP